MLDTSSRVRGDGMDATIPSSLLPKPPAKWRKPRSLKTTEALGNDVT